MDNIDALIQRNSVLLTQRSTLENQVAVLVAEKRGLVSELARERAERMILEARCKRLIIRVEDLTRQVIDEKVEYAKLTEEIEGADDLPSPRSLSGLESISARAPING